MIIMCASPRPSETLSEHLPDRGPSLALAPFQDHEQIRRTFDAMTRWERP